ncbi:MAG TPA: MFS transporter [Thermomicrobiaceae bacterium]|nr:MFS transporter [Thermomicrobiaceae bacterium]
MTATAAASVEVAAPRALSRLLGLTWAHFLNDGAANYLPGVLPAVLLVLHEPLQLAGALTAALSIGQGAQPLAGWLADRIGGRYLVAVGLLASSVGGALLGQARQLWMLLALLLLTGLGSALFHPQALASVRRLSGAQPGILTAAFLVGGEAGRGIWPTAASLIYTQFGLRSLWIVAIPALITAPLLLRWAPPLVPKPRGASIRWRRHARPLTLLLSYRGTRSLVMFGLVTFIPIMWHVRGGSLVSGASIITTLLLVGVIGSLGGGHLADRLGRRPVLVVSSVASAVLILPIAYAHGAWIWIDAAVLGVALFLSASPTVLIGQDIFPENPALGSGIAMGLSGGIGAVFVLALGFLVTPSDVVTVFWVLAAVGLLTVLPALAFPQRLMS